MTDQQEICQICIIFGKHKDHKYTFKQELKKVIGEKLQEVDKKINGFLYQEEMDKNDSL